MSDREINWNKLRATLDPMLILRVTFNLKVTEFFHSFSVIV